MHPIDQGGVALLQGLGGADVGLDHDLFDQLVRLERFAPRDRGHLACLIDHDPPLHALDGQGRAGVAGDLHAGIGGPQRAQHALKQGAGRVVRLAVDRRLGLLVGELGRGAHQAAHEAVAGLSPLSVEHHPHRHAGAVLALAQAAHVGRQGVGQHGLHAVGEIDAVALLPRLAVQGRIGGDIGRDVRDGGPHHPAALVLRVFVGLGINGVVVVAGVGRVDGDQGMARRSVRPLSVGSDAAMASASAASEKPVGMPWLWMAIREAARASSSRPTTSSTRPGLGPKRCEGPGVTWASTRSPSLRSRPRGRRPTPRRATCGPPARSAPGRATCAPRPAPGARPGPGV